MKNPSNPQPALSATKAIYLALITGLIFFTAVVFYINDLDLTFKLDLSDPLLIVTPVLACISIPAGLFYSRSIWHKAGREESLIRKLMIFQTGLIVRLAFCEGVGLLSIIGFLLTGNLLYSIVLITALSAIAYNYPSPDNIGLALDLTESEIENLKSNNYHQYGQ
jgi:hypothetical protein